MRAWVLVAIGVIGCSSVDDGHGSEPSADTAVQDSVAQGPDLDARLADALAAQTVPVTPLSPVPQQDRDVVALGELLFFDPILSGNRDVACATCHHPTEATSDGLVLSLGTGARGVGAAREDAPHDGHLRRRAPTLWNRGRLDVLFWDGRVAREGDGVVSTVALPPGTPDDALAVQAAHPLLDPVEMRGRPGDTDVLGQDNEMAVGDAAAAWSALRARLADVPGYATRLEAAFGMDWTMGDVLAALAAFQRDRYDPVDTPWDRYLAGDLDALDEDATLGALMFYAEERCSTCHAGPLLTDQDFHNIGAPLVQAVDRGRQEITGEPADAFAFRTPPLRHVTLGDGPYLHNGSLPDLAAVLAHYGRPERSAAEPPAGALPDDLDWVDDAESLMALQEGLSSQLPTAGDGASSVGLSNIRAFLEALVDDDVADAAATPPTSVPSGLPVGGGRVP